MLTIPSGHQSGTWPSRTEANAAAKFPSYQQPGPEVRFWEVWKGDALYGTCADVRSREGSKFWAVARLRDQSNLDLSRRVDERCHRNAERFRDITPTHALRPKPDHLVTAEHALRPAHLFAARFGGTNACSYALPDQFALEFREGSKDVEQESGHGIGVIGVDVLRHGDEPNAKRRQFLNTFDGGGYAPPPTV
jgi:hypothetical protein